MQFVSGPVRMASIHRIIWGPGRNGEPLEDPIPLNDVDHPARTVGLLLGTTLILTGASARLCSSVIEIKRISGAVECLHLQKLYTSLDTTEALPTSCSS